MQPGDTKEIDQRFEDLTDIVALELRQAKEEIARQRELQERKRIEAIIVPPTPYNGGLPEGFVQAVPIQPGAGPQTAQPVRPDVYNSPILAVIKKIGQDACSSPPKPIEKNLAWLPWNAFDKSLDSQSQEGSMSACELRVYRLLVNFGRNWTRGSAMTAATVTAEASSGSYSPGGGSRDGVIPPKQDHDEVRRRLGW
jgi:hypothetical protein